MPHTIAEDGEADAAAAAGDAAAAGADAVAAGVLPADESAPAAGTASPPSEAPAAAEIAVAAKGDAAAPGSEAAAVGADAAATTGPALDDANYDPRWEGTLEKHEVGKLNYNELRIADGNKVWREYPADADAGDPNTQNNSEDADAKSATPQRDNRSAAEAPSAEAPSLSQRLAAVADAWSPRLLCASFAGSVVGDHFGSGKAARAGGGVRALATEFEETTPAVAAAPPVAATTAAAAAPPVAATAAAAAAQAATAGAATAASVAAVTTAATPAAPTFPPSRQITRCRFSRQIKSRLTICSLRWTALHAKRNARRLLLHLPFLFCRP